MDILGLKRLNRRSLLMVDFVFVLVTSSSIYTLLAESLRSFLDKSGKRNREKKTDRRRLCSPGKAFLSVKTQLLKCVTIKQFAA